MTKPIRIWLCRGLILAAVAAAAIARAFPQGGADSGPDEISLTARLIQDRATVNETVVLELEVTWTGQGQRFKFEAPQLAASENFRLIGTAVANERWEEGATVHSRRRLRMELQPVATGELHTPPVTLAYFSRASDSEAWGAEQQLISPPLPVEILSPVAAAVSAHYGWAIAGLAGLGGGAAAAVLLVRRRGRRKPAAPAPDEQGPDPWRDLRDRLAELEELLVMGERKKFVTALDALIRQAVSIGLQLNIGGMEGARALETLQGRTSDPELLRAAAVILELSDLVKFAGRAPEPEDAERARKEARTVLALLEAHGRNQ